MVSSVEGVAALGAARDPSSPGAVRAGRRTTRGGGRGEGHCKRASEQTNKQTNGASGRVQCTAYTGSLHAHVHTGTDVVGVVYCMYDVPRTLSTSACVVCACVYIYIYIYMCVCAYLCVRSNALYIVRVHHTPVVQYVRWPIPTCVHDACTMYIVRCVCVRVHVQRIYIYI